MDIYTATEEAYKHGYEKGYADGYMGHWIPVSERLPEKDGGYLVYKTFGKHGWCDVLDFAKDGRKVNIYDFDRCWENVWYNYDSEWGYVISDNVTHWMPLPEAPKVNK